LALHLAEEFLRAEQTMKVILSLDIILRPFAVDTTLDNSSTLPLQVERSKPSKCVQSLFLSRGVLLCRKTALCLIHPPLAPGYSCVLDVKERGARELHRCQLGLMPGSDCSLQYVLALSNDAHNRDNVILAHELTHCRTGRSEEMAILISKMPNVRPL
jgi:hypothetical protein